MIRSTAVLAALALSVGLTVTPATADDLLLGAGQRIDGAAALDRTAQVTAPAGDVNGDGIDDMVIGAPDADHLARDQSGAAYVVFGSKTPAPAIDLNALGSRGFVIGGSAAGDRAGTAVAGADDLNDDGLDDIVIGAPGADFNLRDASGSVYVVFGSASTDPVDLATLGNRGVRIDGAATDDRLGSSVTVAGNVNGDEWLDIAAGAPSAAAAWVILGPFTGGLDLFAPGPSAYRIGGGGKGTGAAVANAEDINGDGRDDLLIGAPEAGFNSRSSSGSTYVVYGLAAPSAISLASLGGAGYRIDGAASTNDSGSALATGDINADGLPDILIAAKSADNNGRNDSGSVFVVFGTPTPGPLDLANLGTGGIRIDGPTLNTRFGPSVAALDLNGDSIDDLVAGSPNAEANGRTASGTVYVINGGPNVASRDLGTSPADRQFDGAAAGDLAGASVASIGDVNGDAGEDLLIGAPNAGNNARPVSGSGYVVFGVPIEDDPLPEVSLPAATLKVKARKASKKIPRTGKVRLVKRVTVGPGQTARIKVTAKPKRTKVTKTATKVTVRTRKAPKRKLTVRITASGTGFTPTTWKRTWRVR
ncbi:MAG: integrin alpha [Candidatus Nanopelagicales bacterium]|nr:integrin alpha [Candidatus Nanopelagicales bacterium]